MATKLTKEQAQEKVYELTEKLIHTKKDMKDVVSGYKDVIKEIESEIKAIVEEVGDTSLLPKKVVTTSSKSKTSVDDE